MLRLRRRSLRRKPSWRRPDRARLVRNSGAALGQPSVRSSEVRHRDEIRWRPSEDAQRSTESTRSSLTLVFLSMMLAKIGPPIPIAPAPSALRSADPGKSVAPAHGANADSAMMATNPRADLPALPRPPSGRERKITSSFALILWRRQCLRSNGLPFTTQMVGRTKFQSTPGQKLRERLAIPSIGTADFTGVRRSSPDFKSAAAMFVLNRAGGFPRTHPESRRRSAPNAGQNFYTFRRCR